MPRKAKRGNNEGTITLRKDGRWEARVSVGYLNGKPQRKCFFGRTREEVAGKLADALAAKKKGLTLHNEKQTLAQFLERWLEEVVKPKVRPSTYRSYKGIVEGHLIPGLGRHPLSKLTPQQVQSFLSQQHESGRIIRQQPEKKEEPKPKSPEEKKTWKNHTPKPKPIPVQRDVSPGISAEHLRRVLRAALNHALKWDLVARNVASLAAAPKSAKHEIKYLDPDQAKTFLEAAKGSKYEALFTVAIAVGLRLGEALGLKWEDVNLTEGMLSVRRQLQRVNKKLVFVEPKTARARRSVPLPDFAVKALQDHCFKQECETRPLSGLKWQDHGLVFCGANGTPLDERTVRRALEALLDSKSLPKLRFHDLRHSCATLLLSQGCDPRTIMETLGHSQITLTLNTYSHVIPALQRDAAEKMERLFSVP